MVGSWVGLEAKALGVATPSKGSGGSMIITGDTLSLLRRRM
ncbi:hypothetical protein [Vulcanisaeta distributa]|nr:hypothetical protein [Vulcanisaeta distributa]